MLLLVILVVVLYPGQAEAKWGFGRKEEPGALGSSSPVTIDQLGAKKGGGSLGTSHPMSLERLGIKDPARVKIINKDPSAASTIDTEPVVPAPNKDLQSIIKGADGSKLPPETSEPQVSLPEKRSGAKKPVQFGASGKTTITTVNPFDDLPGIDGTPASIRRITNAPVDPLALDEIDDSMPIDLLPGAGDKMPVLPDLRKRGGFRVPLAGRLRPSALSSHVPFAKKLQTKLQTYKSHRQQRAMFAGNRALLKRRGF